MGAVDLGDQFRSYHHYDHRFCKGGWRAIAYAYLLEIALINSYIIQLKVPVKWAYHEPQTRWREDVICGLFHHYGPAAREETIIQSGDIFTPISQHEHVNRQKRGSCAACRGIRMRNKRQKRGLREASANNLNRGRAPMTRWGCKQCNVAAKYFNISHFDWLIPPVGTKVVLLRIQRDTYTEMASHVPHARRPL